MSEKPPANVRLIAITKPVISECTESSDLIAYCARVSNPANQTNNQTALRLLSYLARNSHWSPFEMASMTVEVTTTRTIARQILRHRSFSFQEFCIAGSTEITLEMPGAKKRSAYKRTIQHLYKLQESGKRLPSCVRVYDEASRTFVQSPISEVFKTGVKPTFRLTLENGKKIECTKEHKLLTQVGFQTLEDAIGLKLVGSTFAMSKQDVAVGCNGVVAHSDYEWMKSAKETAIASGTGLLGIAVAANVTTHTVRKWLKRLQLSFTKQEVARYTPIWNKGLTGYRLPKPCKEVIEKMRRSAHKGSDSNLWRGGADRSERLKIADWCADLRTDFLRAANYKCKRCSGSLRLELHHIETVASRPDLAREHSNIEVLCRVCHREHHGTNGDAKVWRDSHKGNTLTLHWSKVKSIEYVGEQMTYDMEVAHSSHNYVGNGIVVHNSQRYAAVAAPPVLSAARLQDSKNRQASIQTDDQALQRWWSESQRSLARHSALVYEEALKRGVAKEVARNVLPEGMTESVLYMAGTIRSFIHYCQLRCEAGTQQEHRDVALAVRGILIEQYPAISAILS